MGILRHVAIALALALSLAGPVHAVELRDLEGSWAGLYTYPDRTNPPVQFTMTMRVNGGVCRGQIEEPNTFGDPSTPRLFANTDCRLLVGGGRPRLIFRKVYDGTGGQSHGVDYEGEIASDLRGITGTWRIGSQSGRFSLIKQ